LPAAYRRRLARGQRLSLVLKITVASPSGRPVTFTKRVVLVG
jgi:hypothetical protein